MIIADAVLAVHVMIILFNALGLLIVPIGGLLGWRFVRIRWWRLLHIALLAAVAIQALAGRACILTLWQAALAGAATEPPPLIARLVNAVIYWPLPIWVFAVLYAAAVGWALCLLWLVPSERKPVPRLRLGPG
jgi:Protein of Unknown function (DUF2784)